MEISEAASPADLASIETALTRLGYSVAWPGRQMIPPPGTLNAHRHTALLCLDPRNPKHAVTWLRRISQASLRRHVVVAVCASRDSDEPDWRSYSDVAAQWADREIERGRLTHARDWLHSVATEQRLRGAAPLPALRRARAELHFWLGGLDLPNFDSGVSSDPTELGWRALLAWSHGHASTLAALRVQLESRARGGETDGRFWISALQCLAPSGHRQALVDFEDWTRRVDLPPRRRALAAVICARGWKLSGHEDHYRRLISSITTQGPEAQVARRLESGGRSGLIGVERLVRDTSQMPTADELTVILRQFENAPDDTSALAGGCAWLQKQGDNTAVGIVTTDGQKLVAASGWRPSDLCGEITAIGNGADAGFAMPVRYGGTPLGSVVVRCQDTDRDRMRKSAETLAVVCGSALRSRLDALALRDQERDYAPEIVGRSPAIADLRSSISRAAGTGFPALIEGESGTGKELVARALHRLSPRRDRRFVAVNCAALTDELVEAELFGHTRGAFTGAIGARIGLFEEASGGTLFLDEVSELAARAQAKLLRVLQEQEIRRVGENAARKIDVRIVTATNVPLQDAVAAGRFRDDLRFRLAVVRLKLPPLRDRLEDLPLLVHMFWRNAMADTRKRAVLGADVLACLGRYQWPGNIRELQNVISGLAVVAPTHGRVSRRHAAQVLTEIAQPDYATIVPLEIARLNFERRLVAAALARHAGRRVAAAHDLGLTRQGLAKALRRLGLIREEQAAGVA